MFAALPKIDFAEAMVEEEDSADDEGRNERRALALKMYGGGLDLNGFRLLAGILR